MPESWKLESWNDVARQCFADWEGLKVGSDCCIRTVGLALMRADSAWLVGRGYTGNVVGGAGSWTGTVDGRGSWTGIVTGGEGLLDRHL